MRKIPLFIIAGITIIFSMPTWSHTPKTQVAPTTSKVEPFNDGQSVIPSINTLVNIKKLLEQESSQLDPKMIEKVLMTIQCSDKYNIAHNNILTIIDYSLPANKKRLWVFDLYALKMLFNTYVSHGIRSGTLTTNYFSNRYNSKASSIGVYKTEKSYYGREGLSLRLDGLDPKFNDNASNRSVVMHGGWYVEEQFIQKYGRPGRSWGCPALPLAEYKPIITAIKDSSFLVIYYPSEQWLDTSKFLHCDASHPIKTTQPEPPYVPVEKDLREEVMFAPLKIKTKAEGKEAIMAISADNYQQFFQAKPPLERMLRRQVNGMEYIALSEPEMKQRVGNTDNADFWKTVNFVIPVLVMSHGYYETQMQIINLGTIKEVKLDPEKGKRYTVYFSDKPPVELRLTSQFIRWLGL